MSIANPLTASSVISLAAQPKMTEKASRQSPLQADTGVYAKEMVEISQLGLEKQQKETLLAATTNIADIANETVSISSTIGSARSADNLTNSQATHLYHKIAALL